MLKRGERVVRVIAHRDNSIMAPGLNHYSSASDFQVREPQSWQTESFGAGCLVPLSGIGIAYGDAVRRL